MSGAGTKHTCKCGYAWFGLYPQDQHHACAPKWATEKMTTQAAEVERLKAQQPVTDEQINSLGQYISETSGRAYTREELRTALQEQQ